MVYTGTHGIHIHAQMFADPDPPSLYTDPFSLKLQMDRTKFMGSVGFDNATLVDCNRVIHLSLTRRNARRSVTDSSATSPAPL